MANLEVQNNPFTSILIVEAADAEALPDADPSAGQYRIAVEGGALQLVDSTGTASPVAGAGGYTPGGVDVAVADGGTGASTAAVARTNLGLVLGTDVASLTAGIVPIAQLATGTPTGSKFIRDDGTLQVPAGGSGAAIAAKVTRAAAQTFGTSGTTFEIDPDTEDEDTDTMHFTSAANLTGTVTKTAASATLTGSGTSFSSELTVGQVISVPGTAAERRVVTAIGSNTSLTVNANFANSAAGQTAARVRSVIVFRTAGLYHCTGQVGFASNATGARYALLYVQSGATETLLAVQAQGAAVSGGATPVQVSMDYRAAQWDFVSLRANQSSGGSLNSETTAGYQPRLAVSYQGS